MFVKNLIKSILIAFVTISVLLFVTESGTYKVEPLIAQPLEKEGLHVQALAYTAQESKQYLKENLLSKGYQPVQISIQNNSAYPIGFGDLSVDLPFVSGSEVATQLLKDTIPRAIGFKVASFFFWPFLVPSTIDTFIVYKNQKKLRHDYAAKTVKAYEEILPPYSTLTRVLFVKQSDYKPDFTVSLQDKETGLMHHFPIHT
jgi:hypothetical protein